MLVKSTQEGMLMYLRYRGRLLGSLMLEVGCSFYLSRNLGIRSVGASFAGSRLMSRIANEVSISKGGGIKNPHSALRGSSKILGMEAIMCWIKFVKQAPQFYSSTPSHVLES